MSTLTSNSGWRALLPVAQWLPPHYGIYCYLLGGTFYALFGTSKQLAIGPMSAVAMFVGATVVDGGVNFSLFSRTAAGVELLLFDREEDHAPSRVIPIDPATNRTYHYWHMFVPGVRPGQIYGYRAAGPLDPARGLRFDPSKTLLDPYGRGVIVPRRVRPPLAEPAGTVGHRVRPSPRRDETTG